MNQPIDPNKQISVTLPFGAWQIVTQSLGQMPFNQVHQLIQALGGQIAEQLGVGEPRPEVGGEQAGLTD